MDLKNPSVWSAIIAAIALGVSLFPHVKNMVKGRKVRIVMPEFMLLYHYFGSVNMNLFLVVQNAGGKAVTIAKIDCILTDGGSVRWNLPAHSYYSRLPPSQPGQAPPELLLGWIPLKPGEHWSEGLHCYKFWSVSEERTVNEIASKIRNNLMTKRQQAPFMSMTQNVEADEDLVKEAKDFFQRKFDLSEGNYHLFVAALTESGEVLDVRGCEFTLFENSIRSLNALTEDYKYGGGIISAMDSTKGVGARLRPIAGEQARQAYQKIKSS